jgi:hypothetical protein
VVEQRYKKPQKKESNRNPGDKKSLWSNKKYLGRLLQQTRTSGRQNLRDQRQNRCKQNIRRTFRQTTQEL